MIFVVKREEIKRYRIGNDKKKDEYYAYKDLIMFEGNIDRIKDIEAARWFVVTRNKKRIGESSDRINGKLQKLYDRGIKSFLCKKEGVMFKFEISNDNKYGIGVSTMPFDFDKKFKFTDFHGLEQEIADEYFIYEKFSRFLWNKNGIITNYFLESVKRKHINDWYNKSINTVMLHVNDRIYVLDSSKNYNILVYPEDNYTTAVVKY